MNPLALTTLTFGLLLLMVTLIKTFKLIWYTIEDLVTKHTGDSNTHAFWWVILLAETLWVGVLIGVGYVLVKSLTSW